jgi:hypothetical protein
MKLSLPDVTLVMIDGTCRDLARLSLQDSMAQVDCAEVLVCSPEDIDVAGTQWIPRFMFECTRPSPNSRHFMFHDSFNFPFVLARERLAERLRLMLENPYLQKGNKIAVLRAGRRPLILPRLAAAV